MFSVPWPARASILAFPLRVFGRALKKSRAATASIGLAALVCGTWSAGHAQQSLQTLHNHVRGAVFSRQAALVSSLPPGQNMQLTIVLPLRNQSELTSLLKRLYDPSSPDYRHFLSVDQFTEKFGPTAEDYQAVVDFAKANGFVVTDTPRNRLIVPISGTVAQINAAFNLTMGVYQHPTENRTFFSPDREPSLNLSVPVAHIAGLNNYSIARPMVSRAQGGQAIADVTGSGPGGSYLGSDMRAVYYGGTTLTGNGQAVGLLEFGGYNLSNVNLTFSNAGQTYSVPINNVLLDGATAGPEGDDTEQVLDIVQAIGMAPGLSQVRVYIGPNAYGVDPIIFNSMATENIAKQLSVSWGWIPDDASTDDVFFQEFAAQGQSLFVASGDSGAFDAAISPYFYPAEDSYVTTVGATHLTTNGAGGTWASESAWNSEEAGSGGGISPDGIPIPSWQAGVANSSNGGSTTLRNEPDVAMEGDFDNYACGLEYGCGGAWAGTSFAAPRWAGFMALVNQQAVEAGTAPLGGVGFLNPDLYSIGAGSSYDSDFHDITVGNNDTDNQPVWFSAVSGYDLVTGWGSPTGQSLIDALAGPQTPGFWIAASSGNLSVNQGGSSATIITVTDAGGFTGSVTLAITSALPSGVTASWGTNPTTGTSLLTLTASSSAPSTTSTVTITGTSGALTVTTSLSVAVHAPSFTLTASPNSVAVNQSSSSTSTITVTPQYGFNGSVNLAVTSALPTGVTASWGTNPTTGTSVLTLNASSSATPGTSTVTITGTSGALTETSTLSLAIYGPSFTLSAGGVYIGQGSYGTSYVYVYPQYGFSSGVNLAVTGLPSGVTASFSPNPTSPNPNFESSQLTLTTSSTAAVGQYTLTITGTSGNITATTTITLGVYGPSFTLSAGSLNIGQGSYGTSYVYVNDQYGFNGSVNLSVSGLPSGVTASWNPNPTTNQSILTLTASSTAPVGQYTLTITGTSGNLTATATLPLGVYKPTFTLFVGSYQSPIGQGSSGTDYVYVESQYGFSGSVSMSVSGLPAGVTASFSPNPATSSTNMTLNVSSTASIGSFTLTITGTSGSTTATTTVPLQIATPTFTLSANSATIGQGTSTTTYLYVYDQYGFTGSVNLAASNLPNGVTASFAPNPTTGSSTLTLTASSAASLGQYNVTITGTSGNQTATTTLTLGVYAPTFTLSDNSSVTIGQGSSATSYVYVNDQYGFTGSVNLAVSGLPAGVIASWSPNPTTYQSVLTLTASSTASVGQYTLTITGTSGNQTATTTLSLGVYTPSFTIYDYNSPSIYAGSSGTSTVYVSPQYGFSGSVNMAVTSSLPSGVTASFAPNPTTGSSTLTLTAGSNASLGQYNVTITGTSGAQTAATTITLTVNAPSFTISASPYYVYVGQGGSGTATVTVTPEGSFTGSVSMAVTGLPSGTSASFAPNPTSTGSSILTLTACSNVAAGYYYLTITGTSGSQSASTNIYMYVSLQSFALSDSPGAVNLEPGASGTSSITVIPINGFNGSVSLAASGLPGGVTASFAPNPTTGTSVLTLTASSSATAGTSTATITGTSGGLTATTTLAATVKSAPATTGTTLTASSGGAPVNSVASGTVVNLTAKVSAGATAVTTGQVKFCDATAAYCEDTHLLGTAQLTSAGTAVLKFVPGMGSHSFKAVFVGTNGDATSSSNASTLTVTASNPTTTTIAQSGVPGNYTLTATVTGQGLLSPNGTISFLDTSNGNASVGTAALGQGATAVSWLNPQSLTIGQLLGSVAIGDFNGDGIPDLAVANEDINNVAILLGNGNGTFTQTPVSPSTASGISTIAVGDFNQDGKLDLAVANGNIVTVLLGNGDGTFTTAPNPSTADSPLFSMAVGDFNGDGIPDLAVLNNQAEKVTILLGNGDGTFTPAASPATGAYPKEIIVGDFNRDGKPDLAVVNEGSYSVTILLGNGDGTFAPAPVSPTTAFDPQALAVGDFNADGIPDLAVVGVHGTITILLGNGDGTFTPTLVSPATSDDSSSIAVGDFNGDGKVDLAVASELGSVSTLLGNGDGTFTVAMSPSAGPYPHAIASGDLNGDGIPDLVVVNLQDPVTILTSQLTQTATATASGISPGGAGPQLVDAKYPGDNNYSSSISGTTTISAPLATPTVTVTPSPSSITTAQALTVTVAVSDGSGNPTPTGSVTLVDGGYSSAATNLSRGSAAINVPAGSLAPGIDTLTVSYTPDATGSSIYNSATGSNSVTVTVPATPAITWATPAAITYGTALSTAQLNASSTVAGSYSYSPAAGTVLGSGPQTLSVTFTPADTTDYTTATASVTLIVAQATPAITWTKPASITYGTALSTTQLNASSTVSGSYSYSPAAGTVLSAGSQTLSVTFTPTDKTDYTTATATVTLAVNQASPSIFWPTPAAITYGTALSATQLNASTTVAGAFGYSPASGAVLSAGTQALSVTFTPTDTTDYTAATATVILTVNQAMPTLTWATPAPFTYGTSLSATQLNATSTIAGSFAYSPTVGTVMNVGSQKLTATFTPTDSSNYTSATATVMLTVNKATPAITWATPAAIIYGTALSTTQLIASSTVAGSFSYSPAAGTVLGAGSQTLTVTFTPNDATDYTTATASVALTVTQAVPTITWAKPASITYGTALSTAQLNASSLVAGSFSYSPAAGTVLGAGSQTLTVTFTPTDTTDYTTATASVTLTVNKVTPTVTVTPSPSSITTAQALTVTVALSGGSGGSTPTGSVTLTSGSYSSASTTLNSGGASINIPAGSLVTGADTLTVSYTGDANFNSGAGSASIPVTTPVSPSFTVTGTAVTVARGANTGNASSITLTPSGGFTGNVALTAAITSSPAGAQYPPTLSFGSTSPVNIAGAAGAATLTISTTAATSAGLVRPNRRGIPWYATGGATLACLMLFGIPARRRSWRILLGMLVLLVAFAGGAVACGGGGSGSGGGGGGGTGNSGTTAGTYTVTVTGTSSSTVATGAVTLTVQ